MSLANKQVSPFKMIDTSAFRRNLLRRNEKKHSAATLYFKHHSKHGNDSSKGRYIIFFNIPITQQQKETKKILKCSRCSGSVWERAPSLSKGLGMQVIFHCWGQKVALSFHFSFETSVCSQNNSCIKKVGKAPSSSWWKQRIALYRNSQSLIASNTLVFNPWKLHSR